MEKINIVNHQSILRLRIRYIINGQSLAVQIEKSAVVSPAYGVKHRVIEGGKTVNMSIVRLANISDGGHVVAIGCFDSFPGSSAVESSWDPWDRITVVSADVLFARSHFARTESRFARSMKSFRPD